MNPIQKILALPGLPWSDVLKQKAGEILWGVPVAVTTPVKPKFHVLGPTKWALVRSLMKEAANDLGALNGVPGRFCVPEYRVGILHHEECTNDRN